MPVPQVREVKEIECQKCRKYKVPVQKTRWVKECNPVYDEKCKTEYHQHCKEETRCHQLYQTICDNSGYQQVRMLGGFKLMIAYSRAASILRIWSAKFITWPDIIHEIARQQDWGRFRKNWGQLSLIWHPLTYASHHAWSFHTLLSAPHVHLKS